MSPASRRQFLQQSAAMGAIAASMAPTLAAARSIGRNQEQPVLFIGHGSPMNALRSSDFTRTLVHWGEKLGKPAAILMVSAHWLTPGLTAVDIQAQPATLADFSGFPIALHQMKYPAEGAPEMARGTAELVTLTNILPRHDWGFDHGAWSVLVHLFPKANVPVFQLSIDYSKAGPFHLALGRELAALRRQGVLIIGSGNIVHNLGRTQRGVPDGLQASQPWAQAFDDTVKEMLAQRQDAALATVWHQGSAARMAVPTPDHYFPLLYSVGAARPFEQPQTIFEGFQAGTVSMRCLQFGDVPDAKD